MSLTSVLQTALSGMSAATTTLDVVSNNLANMRTDGFKASRPVFAPRAPTTLRAGTAPGPTSGGSNPIQIGTGVRTVAITTDFSQGPLVASVDGPVELSNTDVGENIVDLILAENQFAANALVFRTADSMLDQLSSLSRSDN